MDLIFWGVFVFIALDLAILKRRSPSIAQEAFSCTPMRAIIFCAFFIFLILGSLLTDSPQQTLSFSIIFFIGWLYLAGRHKFKSLLKSVEFESASPKIILAAETMAMFLQLLMWAIVGSLVYGFAAYFYRPLFVGIVMDSVLYLYLSAVIVVLIIRLSSRQPLLSLRSLTGISFQGLPFWKAWVLPVLLGVGCAIIGSILLAGRPEIVTPFTKMTQSINTPALFLMFAGLALLLAPVVEEIFFRGFLYAVIKSMRGVAAAIIITAGLFTVLHVGQYWGDIAKIAMIGALSVVLTFLRAWTGSTIPGIIAHATANFSVMFIGIIMAVMANAAYFQYSTQYERLKPQEREALLIKSIEQQPDFATPYNDLAWQYAQENRNLDEAFKLVNKALTLKPIESAFLDTKAEVLYKMGKIQEAINIETDLVKRNPKVQIYHDQLKKFQKARH